MFKPEENLFIFFIIQGGGCQSVGPRTRHHLYFCLLNHGKKIGRPRIKCFVKLVTIGINKYKNLFSSHDYSNIVYA